MGLYWKPPNDKFDRPKVLTPEVAKPFKIVLLVIIPKTFLETFAEKEAYTVPWARNVSTKTGLICLEGEPQGSGLMSSVTFATKPQSPPVATDSIEYDRP
jgi:hypothetical protein